MYFDVYCVTVISPAHVVFVYEKMKLLTHNFLTSKAIKGVKVGHPLILNVSSKQSKVIKSYPRRLSEKFESMEFITEILTFVITNNIFVILHFQIAQKEEKVVTFNGEFLTRILPRLHWPAVCTVAEQVGVQGLPAELNEADATEEVLQKLHHVLLEIDVIEGNLKCPETGRLFPITDGIPNMLLNEFET